MTHAEYLALRDSLRRAARVWLGGEAIDQLERLFAWIERSSIFSEPSND